MGDVEYDDPSTLPVLDEAGLAELDADLAAAEEREKTALEIFQDLRNEGKPVPNRRELRRNRVGFSRKWYQRRSPRPCPRSITAHLPRRDVYVRAMVRKMKRENSDQSPSE